jgi:biotin synthase-related radical SAM superfamily protein
MNRKDYSVQMETFVFKMPILRGSTKIIDIFDENHNRVGSIQRIYRNKLEKIIDFILNDAVFVNVQAFDTSNNLVCKVKEKISIKTMIRSKWEGKSINLGDFWVFDKTIIKTNPKLQIEIPEKNEIFTIHKDFADKRVFIKNNGGKIVAEIKYDKPVPPQTITIQMKSGDMHYLDVACLYYLFIVYC